MKKKELSNKVLFPEFSNKKLVLMLNWTIILTFLFVLKVSANSYSQNVKVDLDFQNVKFKRAFSILEQKANIRLLYSEENLPVGKYVTLSVRDTPVMDVLGLILKDTDLKFRVLENGLIVISPRNNEIKEIVVRGQVTDSKGETLPGVSIKLKGTAIGATTDLEGRYSINVPDNNSILVFTYIGYVTQEVEVDNRTSLNVKLEAVDTALGEVVVIGFGTQKKVNLTGAVSSISGKELTIRPVGQTSAALQGIAPGVTVVQRSGKPGGDGGTIRIRGVGTLGNSNPLVLIDGVESSLDNMDPNLIESISILKDAASSAIYGSRAANGVVLVTTKRAKGDQLTANYSNYLGWQAPTNLPTMVNALDHMLLTNEAYVNVGRQPLYSNALLQKYQSGEAASNRDLYPDTDWQREVLTGTGFQQSHFLSINGGGEKVRFITSIGYFDQDGIIQNSNHQRYTLRNNADIVFSDKLSARLDVQLINTVTTQPGRGTETVFHWMNRVPPDQVGRLSNGLWGEGWNGDNPIAISQDGGNRRDNNSDAIFNFALNYQPVEWLKAEVMLAPKYSQSPGKSFVRAVQTYKANGTPSFLAPNLSSLTEDNNRVLYNTMRGILTYDKVLGRHGIKVLGGYQQEDYRGDNISAYRDRFILPDYPVLNAGAADNMRAFGSSSEWALQSFFGRANYEYGQKYLLEANARYDGSSRFAKGNKFSFFPSISAGWRISQEPFMQPLTSVLNELKLRASWGRLGNQLIQGGNYPFASSISLGTNYSFGKAIRNGAALRDLANSNISWETTEMTNFGLDMVLFSNLTVTADYYFRQTRDILLSLDIPLIVGLNAPQQNAGVVNNRGWELGVTYRGFVNKFRYDVNMNLSDVRNEVVDMRGISRTGLTVSREGYPINSILGLEALGFFQTAEEVAKHAQQFGVIKPGDIKYKDQNKDGIINDLDNVIIGSTIPRYTFGTTFNAYFKGFNLNVFLQGVGKADGYLYQQGIMPFFLGGTVQEQHKDRWTPETPNAKFPRLAFSGANNEKNSSLWMKDASYLRLRNVQVGYTIPSQLSERLALKDIRLFVNGANLLTFDRFWNGYDVEAPVGTGNQYPQVKMVSFGLNANF